MNTKAWGRPATTTKPRRQIEAQRQRAFIQAFILVHKDLWTAKKLFAIPNGGARDAKTAALMKAEGVTSGVWDLFLAIPRGQFSGLFIETKSDTGTLSDQQKAFKASLEVHYAFAVCRQVDEFLSDVAEYLAMPLKHER